MEPRHMEMVSAIEPLIDRVEEMSLPAHGKPDSHADA
jgi:hypothetical protein